MTKNEKLVTFFLLNKMNLVRACQTNNKSNVIRFINNINYKDGDERTPLFWAVLFEYNDIVKILIDNRANVNQKDKYGHTPLMWASANGFINICKLLLKAGANINENGYALILATQNNKKEVVKLLLNSGVNINFKDENNKTAIIWASELNNSVKKIIINYVNNKSLCTFLNIKKI